MRGTASHDAPYLHILEMDLLVPLQEVWRSSVA